MRHVRFGVGLFATENACDSVRLGQCADSLGFDRFWVGDSHMIWREAFVMLGAIAATTKNILIAPGVTHPLVRHMTVIVSAMATLNELAAGRAVLGVGVGATGPENIGIEPLAIEEFSTILPQLKT